MTGDPIATSTFRCEVDDEPDATGIRRTIRLGGEFDGAAVADVEAATAHLGIPAHLRVDMSEVTFIDSMGLRVLVKWQRDALGADSAMMLWEPTTTVRRLLVSTALVEIFTIVPER